VVYHVKSETKFDFQLSFTGVDVKTVASNTREIPFCLEDIVEIL